MVQAWESATVQRRFGKRSDCRRTVVAQGAAILELLSGKDETLLVRWDTLLVLDLRLDVVDGVRGLDLEGDGLAGEAGGCGVCVLLSAKSSNGTGRLTAANSRLDEDLHLEVLMISSPRIYPR
jgi:hypothetical protein